MTKKSMSKSAAARIQAAEAKSTGGSITKGSFAARAQSAADKAASAAPPAPTIASSPSSKNRVTKTDAQRIQSTQSRKTGGNTEKGSFTSRVQSTVDKNKKR